MFASELDCRYFNSQIDTKLMLIGFFNLLTGEQEGWQNWCEDPLCILGRQSQLTRKGILKLHFTFEDRIKSPIGQYPNLLGCLFYKIIDILI